MTLRLRIFVTHPVQYHVPLWRALAAHPDLDVKVFYFSDHSVRGGIDNGFGVPVAWDVDLMGGYANEFLSRSSVLSRPSSVRIEDPNALLRREKPDWILIAGYTMAFERQLADIAHHHNARILMRAEFCDLSERRRSRAKHLIRTAYLRWFYRKVDAFCYPGEQGRRHLKRLGVNADRMFHSPYSVDNALIERAKQATSRRQARDELGIPEARITFLFSGKLIPRKDPMALLEGLSRVHDIDRVGLIVLGDGELRASFESAARALLGDRLIHPGFVNQSELGRYFLASDCLVLPSRHETWGLVVNEAMHYGLPVIVSDQVGSAMDLVRPGETGWIYKTGSADELGAALRCVVARPDAAARMGEAGRLLVDQYTIRQSAKGVIQALGLEC